MIEHHGLIILRHRNHFNLFERTIIFHEATSNGTHKTEYAYDKDNRVTAVTYNGSANTKVSYVYDKLNRITSRTIKNGVEYNTQYGYVQGDTAYGNNATTPLVQSITQGSGTNAFILGYTYDDRGNITSETRNGNTTTYGYDALGQLVRVNDPCDNTIAIETQDPQNTGTTWIYAYDRGGNILSKTAYAYTREDVGTAIRSLRRTDKPNMYENYTRQSLPERQYRELLGSALCVFNSNNAFIIENILRFDYSKTCEWKELIDLESGRLLKRICQIISSKCGNRIEKLFDIIVEMRNRIIHSFQITYNGQQMLATKEMEKDGGTQFIITEDYLLDFIKKNEELSLLLHELRGF